MELTDSLVASLFGCPEGKAASWTPHLSAACAAWGVDTPVRLAMFAAQAHVESAGLTELEENLRYSAPRLMQVFRPHFKDLADARMVALRGPQGVANRVYANRMGNGAEGTGDGWKFHGRGIFQLTGKNEYWAYTMEAGVAVALDPDKVLTPHYAADTAGWYWHANGMSRHDGDVVACTKIINPALEGLDRRKAKFLENAKILGVQA